MLSDNSANDPVNASANASANNPINNSAKDSAKKPAEPVPFPNPRGTVETAAGGNGTVNDPAGSDTRPPYTPAVDLSLLA